MQDTPSGGRSQPVNRSNPDTWTRMLRVWPMEARPAEMLDREFMNSFTFDQAVKYKEHWVAEMKIQGKGEQVFGRDSLPPTQKFAAAEDNCADKLCAAR